MTKEHCARRAVRRVLFACAALALCAPALAEDDAGNAPARLPDVDVIGVTPLAGAGVPIDRVPFGVQVAGPDEFDGGGGAQTLYDFVERNFSGVSAVDLQNNPYQRNFNYRGFVAGPLLGESVGIAAFQNGVRVNDPFGDVVQSDLFPEMAIRGMELGNANPAFGFNALGGALVFLTHDGTTFQGAEASQSGGSFGRLRTTLRAGVESGEWNAFAAYQRDREDGWRDASPSALDRLFAAGGADGENASFRVNVSWADTDLIGNGLAPIELYRAAPEAIFTYPDQTVNRNLLISTSGEAYLDDEISIQANAYYRRLRRGTLNGDEIEAANCGSHVCGGDDDDDDEDEDGNGEMAGRDGDDDDEEENDNGDDRAERGHDNGDEDEEMAENDDDDDDEEEMTRLYDRGGAAIPAIGGLMDIDGDGEPDDRLGALNTSETESTAWGAGLQALIETPLGGMDNQFIIGAGLDVGRTEFISEQEVGRLRYDDRAVVPARGGGAPRYVAGIHKEDDDREENDICDDEICRTETAPVDLVAENKYYRIYASDTLDIGGGVSFTASVAANMADISLEDRSVFLGARQGRLTGSHDFFSLNPALGATWTSPDQPITVFGGFRQGNRAPSPAELSCADPDDPCNLPNAFVADPPLEQVVSRTFEAGVRGSLEAAGGIDWTFSAFTAANSDDIIFVAAEQDVGSGVSSGYFRNVSETRRRGVELALSGDLGQVDWYANYGYVEATFQSAFDVFAENHPRKSSDNTIAVRPGHRIPGVPAHSLNLGVGIEPFDGLRIAPNLVYRSGVYYRGDEANLADPTDDYTVVNVDASYRVADWLEIFGRVDNILDKKYHTFGIFGETAELGDDGEVEEVEVPIRQLADEAVRDPRFISPGQPLTAIVGVRILLN